MPAQRPLPTTLADNDQDGYQDPYHSNTILGVGESYDYMSLYSNQHIGGLRYQLPVPRGAQILAATLSANFNNEQTDSPRLAIQAERTDNAPAMNGSDAYELSNKTKTWASAIWNADNLGTGWHDSPDLKNVIQAIVNRDDWQSNNHILLILTNYPDDNGEGLDFYQREGSNPGAKLNIGWEIGQ